MAAGVHTLDVNKFEEAYKKCMNGEISQVKAAEMAGCSRPTFRKYVRMILLGEQLPDNLFEWDKLKDETSERSD